jgi:hypothetical protein
MSEEPESELVEFKVILDSVWHNEPPKYQVLLNGELIESGEVVEKAESDDERIITFSKDLIEGDHVLQIRLIDKQNRHTPIDESGNILADQLLNIKQIEIDDIELDYLFYSLGKYYKQCNPIDAIHPLYESEPLPENYKNLGWNGEYRLAFQVPTYIWFLENL